jgi:hypothetical protein
MSRKQNIEQFKGYFKDFAPAIQKLLSYVKEAYVWRMMETMPPSWVSKSGRVVLIGDAAHAALPWVGQVSISLINPVVLNAHKFREVAWHLRMQQLWQNV